MTLHAKSRDDVLAPPPAGSAPRDPRRAARLAHRRAAAWVACACALAWVGCDDHADLPEDPELAVPGHEVTPAPPPNPGMPTAMAAPEEFDPPLAVPGYEELPPPPMPEMPPGMQPGQVPPGMQPGQMPPGMQPGQAGAMQPGQPISLATGFSPDPTTANGVAGGPAPASSMASNCVGFVNPQQPNHVVTLTTAFSNLRIVVSSEQDTTLVVAGPDGSYRCNDDAQPPDRNPVVQGQFVPGAYRVYVGSYQSGVQSPYVIGFTERPGFGPAQLAQAAQQAQAGQQAPPGGAPPMQPSP